MRRSIKYVAALSALLLASEVAVADRCLFVSSYHRGYAWSDGVESGLRKVLDGKCEIKQFDMDTKRKKTDADKEQAALAAKTLIESWKPDVVITADDNAAKYLIQPYFRDHTLPFVFCGVNWTAAEYGFPYSNVTGMVEVAPIRPMLEKAVSISGRRAFYIGAKTLTEQKNLARFENEARRLGMELDHRLVATTAEWAEAYDQAQAYDFIVMGSNSGINDWDHDTVVAKVKSASTKLSITNHGWMMPYTMFGMTKVPAEQGEWAAATALAILAGSKPTSIPIIANRKWDIWVNQEWIQQAGVKLPRAVLAKAKRR